jgi:peptidoglycan/xylan/chitin deacetylase (PgdA/CDA1 family)
VKSRVYITVDTECAEERLVRGTLQPALGYDLRVWGRFANHDEELGIPLIMRELEAEGLRATFFVEPFGARHFGIDGLAAVCRAIRARGHDVQLHAHPMQQRPCFRSEGVAAPPDDLCAYDVDGQTELLRRGLDTLEEAGVPRAELRAFRAGNFGADERTWEAMARCGLTVSSNSNPNYGKRNCKIPWRGNPGLFDTEKGVFELPVSNFSDGNGGFRHLQIMAVSLAEMKDYLVQAHALGIREITLFTHSFEFFYIDDLSRRHARVSTINVSRLRGLARFLRANAGRFEVETVGDLARRGPVPSPAPAGLPRLKRLHQLGRMLEQLRKRVGSGFKVESHYSE